MIFSQPALRLTESSHFGIYDIHIYIIMAPFHKWMIHFPNVPYVDTLNVSQNLLLDSFE